MGNKLIIRALVVAVCLVMVATKSETRADSPSGLHKFYVLYAVVSNLKNGGKDKVDFALKFLDASPKAAYSLAEFWWAWALRDCFPYLEKRIEQISRLTDKAEIKKQSDLMQDEHDSCVEGFIFQRWGDINESIENKFANFPKDN